VTALFRDDPRLATLNGNVLSDPHVEIVNADAWEHIKGKEGVWDVAILDLPDPKDLAISKLYSRAFYADVAKALNAGGVMVTQATSPIYAPGAFWTIATTLEATADPWALERQLQVMPYHAYVPSFGAWGFVLAGGRLSREPLRDVPEGVTFFAEGEPQGLFRFPPDMARMPVEPNTLFDHPLPRLYEEGWSRWYR